MPTLYVTATPIGNLEDLSERAARVLKTVPLVIAEDTRRTKKLLSHLGSSAHLVSFHEHSSRERAESLVAKMNEEDSAAYVTDAGVPGVSDPGARLVQEAFSEGLEVIPVPGPSAVTAALSVCGFEGHSFYFAGFPPSDSSSYSNWLENQTSRSCPVVLFLPPHRADAFLEALTETCPDRPLLLARELTKKHEQLLRGTPEQVRKKLLEGEVRGEMTVVLEPVQTPKEDDSQAPPQVDLSPDDLSFLQDELDLPPTDVAKIIARFTPLSRGEAYELLLE